MHEVFLPFLKFNLKITFDVWILTKLTQFLKFEDTWQTNQQNVDFVKRFVVPLILRTSRHECQLISSKTNFLNQDRSKRAIANSKFPNATLSSLENSYLHVPNYFYFLVKHARRTIDFLIPFNFKIFKFEILQRNWTRSCLCYDYLYKNYNTISNVNFQVPFYLQNIRDLYLSKISTDRLYQYYLVPRSWNFTDLHSFSWFQIR